METHRIILSLIVCGIIVASLMWGEPSVTGFVPTETFSQELDIFVDGSQRFSLSSDEPLYLTAFSISGLIKGPGLVNVYLVSNNGKSLVYSNKKKPVSSMESITGMSVLTIEPTQRIDKIEVLPPGYKTQSGVFQNECSETCILQGEQLPMYLDVIIEPGTTVQISEIRFANRNDH